MLTMISLKELRTVCPKENGHERGVCKVMYAILNFVEVRTVTGSGGIGVKFAGVELTVVLRSFHLPLGLDRKYQIYNITCNPKDREVQRYIRLSDKEIRKKSRENEVKLNEQVEITIESTGYQ
ncbi:hypothetical protein CHS0354_010594 [Potamilus streckersoni]|uniref:Uncharacterized protein n=1 Tax=Potamilus streckersoni TaxID=2493646 RepID=A0AAE0VQZ8_9BIVA|nr:hypothetical protein CHS0354_010594 [Potamilus streckersoni]